MAKIKQVLVGGINYDFDAAYLGGLSAQEWEDMIDAHHAAIVGPYISISNPSQPEFGTERTTLYDDQRGITASQATGGAVYLFNQTDTSPYYEWITINKGDYTHPNYVWKCIGSTSTDLSNYVKKGSYTTDTSSATVTDYAEAAGGDEQISTEGADYESTQLYDATFAKIYTPIKTSESSTHTHTVTLPILTATFTDVATTNGMSRKYLYPSVKGNGNHTHAIDVIMTTVATNWSATVNGEILSFSLTTASLPHVQPTEEESGTYWGYTGEDGAHTHYIQYATSSTATSAGGTFSSPAQYIEDVGKIPTFTLYYAGVSSSTDSMSANVSGSGAHSHTMNTASYNNPEYYKYWEVAFSIRQHSHRYQHVHGMSHTHDIDLTVAPNS